MVNWCLVVLSVLSLLTLLLVLLMLPCLIIVIVIIVIIAVFGSRCLVCTGNNDMNAEGYRTCIILFVSIFGHYQYLR